MFLDLFALDLALEHGVDCSEDGQIEAALVGEIHGDFGRRHAFHCGFFEDILHFFAFDDARATRSVARETAKGGEHQVANSRQARDGTWLAAHRDAELLQFQGAARHKRSKRVDAVACAFNHAGADGQRVLQCTAQLHANDILRAVDAEIDGRQQALHVHCMVQVLGRHDHSTWCILHQFQCKRRAWRMFTKKLSVSDACGVIKSMASHILPDRNARG